jgi:diaminopimelate epimerase
MGGPNRRIDISKGLNELAGRKVAKMNGAGNEILVMDLRGAGVAATGADARAIRGDRRLEFDQLMVVSEPRSPGADAFVTIFNNDGSEAGACGNGARCVAYALMRDGGEVLRLETREAVLTCRRRSDLVFEVDMGRPRWGWRDIPLRDPLADTRRVAIELPEGAPASLGPASLVNMGNPHAIFWVENIDTYDLAAFGPLLETHPLFPERANISLARVEARDRIQLKVWERGAGLTRACGSAACAALVAAARLELTDRRAAVRLPGGELTIQWRSVDDHVLMTGPVEFEFETTLAARLFEPTT